MDEETLTGTYQLLSWENRHASGQTTYPLGADARGIIHYAEDGYMFVHIMSANRTAYSDGDMFGGETSEIVEGAKSHISYCGTYRVDDDEVIHTVQVSSFPNWVSTQQRRHFEFKDGYLILSAQGLKIGNEIVDVYLIWQSLGRSGSA